jgi:hypothetical protein
VGSARAGSSPAFGTINNKGQGNIVFFLALYFTVHNCRHIESLMHPAIKKNYHVIIFYVIKLPLIYLTLAIGSIFQFLITFPYILICFLDGISTEKKAGKPSSTRPSASVRKSIS